MSPTHEGAVQEIDRLRAELAAAQETIELLRLPVVERLALYFERYPEARKLSQRELAQRLNTRRESINKALAESVRRRRALARARRLGRS